MWFTAAAQLIGGELQAHPLDTRNPYALAPTQSNPWMTALLVVGGLAAVGGIYYFMVRR